MSLLSIRLRWKQILRSERPEQLRVAVLASFTAAPIVPYCGVALEDLGLPADIWIGPFNQIAQECLSDASETAAYNPDLLLCWPRLEELWSGQPLPLVADNRRYVDDALALAETCLDAARRWQCTLIFVLPALPEVRPLGLGDAHLTTGIAATATLVREQLRRRLSGQRHVLLLDLEEIVRALGSSASYDERMFAIAKIPFTEACFQAVGERLARLIRISRRAARKVVVVDADHTLWGGVVGEDGMDGVDLRDGGAGEAFRSFQAFLLELRRAGVLLALCSKNHEDDVRAVFERREMRLKQAHFAAWRIGWQPKSEVLRQIADELGLGLDSLVLIDDNPAEIAEVSAALPEVACICMPADPAEWPRVMAAAGCLDRLPPTAEDLQRADFYAQERQRESVRSQSISREEYLAQLDVQVQIFAPTAGDLPRLSQLVTKTNQFNLNCRRRSQPELAALCADQRYVVRLIQAQDRYGDYGIVGAYIVDLEAQSAELDTFLLSCRALGRGIEEAMLADLFDELEQRGQHSLVAAVEEHPRNEPARRFFASLGAASCGQPGELRRPGWPAYIVQGEAARR
ncbi:MAG TPA: HAD-IIIC family phosphatase [Herpetosiphonaceae bacterium]